MKTKKRKLSAAEKEEDAPAPKRRCVVGSHGRRVAIVKVDPSSLMPLEEHESDRQELAFLNKNETALARLLERLETSSYHSFIMMKNTPDTGSDRQAKEALFRFFDPLLGDQPCSFIFKKNMSVTDLFGVERLLRKYRTPIEHTQECRAIHFKSTLMPAIELSLGKDFPFEATVLSIFNRLSHLANANRIGRPVQDAVLGEFSSVGYAVLVKSFVALSMRKKTTSMERELKDLVDVIEVLSRKNSHFYGIMS